MENTQNKGETLETAVQNGSARLMTGSCLCQHGLKHCRLAGAQGQRSATALLRRSISALLAATRCAAACRALSPH